MEPHSVKTIERDSDLVGRWVADRLSADWFPGAAQAIGLKQGDELIAGVIFEGYNGASCRMHVAALPGRRWLNRPYLYICFDYVFRQLNCNVAIGLVEEINMEARRFDEHLGFKLAATLPGACQHGALLIYTMHRDECRWIQPGTHYGEA